MEPLELKKSKLASIADQHAFAVQLSKRLISGDSNPCIVLCLSRILKERLGKMKVEVEEAYVLPVAGELNTDAMPMSQLVNLKSGDPLFKISLSLLRSSLILSIFFASFPPSF